MNVQLQTLRFALLPSFVVLLLLALSACSNKVKDEEQASQDDRPNVVFILVDDLGYGMLGHNGQRDIQTPNIDQLAAKGASFTHAYSGGPVCSPSRISLLTGLDGRLLHNNTNAIKLKKNNVTFPQLLRKSGYDTMLVGKYGVGKELGVNDPMFMGFNNWYGIMTNVPAHRQYPESIFVNNQEQVVSENLNGKKGRYAQEMWTAKAKEYLQQQHDKPFFLYLSYTSPHAELAAPQKYLSKYENKFDETPYLGMSDGKVDHYYERFYPEPVEQPNATVAAMVTALDDYLGQIVETLEAQSILDNTIIIFTSDNGVHEEGGFDPSYFDSSKPFRGIKRDLTEGGIHVPFIVRWDKALSPGTVIDEPIAFADMLPTFADMADAQALVTGLDINGRSVYSLFTGEKADLPDHLMYWEFVRQLGLDNTRSVTQAIREGQFKAVRYGADAEMYLFDVTSDPGETVDLKSEHPEKARRYISFLDERLHK